MSVKAEYLNSFCLAARERSISAAARALGLSQPAVSRQLLLLQEEYGTALYEPGGLGITLTPAGRMLLPYACAVSQALLRARKFIEGEAKEEETELRIGLSHHLTTRFTGLLLRATRLYNDSGHSLRLHLLEAYSDDLVQQLFDGSIDAAYLVGVPGEARAAASRVGEERIMLLVKGDDPLAGQPYWPLGVLQGETLVVPSHASSVYRSVVQALEGARVQPGRVLEVSGPAAVRSAILDGLGIGVTLESFVRPEVSSGALRLLGIEASGMVAGVWRLERKEELLLPGQRRSLDFLAERV